MFVNLILRLVLFIGSINFLILRKEETIPPRPKWTSHRNVRYNFSISSSTYLSNSITLIHLILPRQTQTSLLLIGVVEKNPGPTNFDLCCSCLSSFASPDTLECSVCFRLYHFHCISKLSSCTNSCGYPKHQREVCILLRRMLLSVL